MLRAGRAVCDREGKRGDPYHNRDAALQQPEHQQRAADGGAGSEHHLRHHGRDQLRPRRVRDGRRLHHLRGGPVAARSAGRELVPGGAGGGLRGHGRTRLPYRALADPLPVRAPVREHPGDLGPEPHPAAARPQRVRRLQRGGAHARLAAGRPGAGRGNATADQPAVHHRSGAAVRGGHLPVPEPDPGPGAACAR